MDPIRPKGTRGSPLPFAQPTDRWNSSFFSLIVLIVFALMVGLPLAGCGGGSSEEDDTKVSSRATRRKNNSRKPRKAVVKEEEEEEEEEEEKASTPTLQAQKDALKLQKECEEQGLDRKYKDDFDRAMKKMDKAESDLLNPKTRSKARYSYKRASTEFKEILAEGEEASQKNTAVLKAKKLAGTAKQKADKIEAEINAPEEYEEALEFYNDAIADLEEASASSLISAEDNFSAARTGFEDAADIAKGNKRYRFLAENLKVKMDGYKARALENDADTKALRYWQQAESLELEADAAFQSGAFQEASGQYSSAAQTYTDALKSVLDETAFKAELATIKEEQKVADAEFNRRRKEELEIASRFGRPRVPPPPPPGTAPPPGITPQPPGVGTPGIAAVAATTLFPTCVAGVDPALFPQELDEEDEAFLIENIHELSKKANYDPETGGIILDYTNGQELQKEIIKGRTPKTNLGFVDPQMLLAGADIPDEAQISMDGNTSGMVFFPVPFKYKVRMTWVFNILTMSGDGDWGAIVNYNTRTNNRYRTNFLDIGSIKGSSPPKWQKMPGKPGANANNWHTKLRPVNWIVELDMNQAGGGGEIRSTYDSGGTEELSNKIRAKKLSESGLVGFQWKKVKFRIRKLVICGFLDKQEAVRRLRKQLGVKKEGAKKKKPKKEPDPDPTAPADEGEDKKKVEKKKVEDDDFDY